MEHLRTTAESRELMEEEYRTILEDLRVLRSEVRVQGMGEGGRTSPRRAHTRFRTADRASAPPFRRINMPPLSLPLPSPPPLPGAADGRCRGQPARQPEAADVERTDQVQLQGPQVWGSVRKCGLEGGDGPIIRVMSFLLRKEKGINVDDKAGFPTIPPPMRRQYAAPSPPLL